MSATTATTPRAAASMRGLGLYALALLIFAGQDGLAKHLVHDHSPALVSAVRYSTQALLLTALLPRPLRAAPRDAAYSPWLVLVRSLCLASLTVVMMGAFARLPLAEATAISFLAPLLVTVLAVPLLGERPGPLRWIGTVGGFLGLLLIVRPGGNLDAVGVALAFLAAVLNTGYQLLSRVLQGVPSLHLLYHSALTGSVFGIGAVLLARQGGPVSWADLGLMAVLGLTGGSGHYLLTVAYRTSDASLLAPLTYLQLVFAAVVGWLVFHQLPDAVALTGMALVCVSGVLAVLDSRRKAVPAPLEV
ncbi:DMT family transporter [Deinococcus yunweiensis]|uniref:DMT family transporter n=1 Tax=Deinococcus yunweiensis TaxID=367282 RepID=UPI00398F56EF